MNDKYEDLRVRNGLTVASFCPQFVFVHSSKGQINCAKKMNLSFATSIPLLAYTMDPTQFIHIFHFLTVLRIGRVRKIYNFSASKKKRSILRRLR